jgi:hypothetical protein
MAPMHRTFAERHPPPSLSLPQHPTQVSGVFWRTSPAFVDELTEFLQGKSVLEVFAGNGYLSAWLNAKGVKVTATSILSGHDSHEAGMYAPVQELKASAAVSQLGGSHDVLLMTWPVVTMDVLYACKAWGRGRDIIFVGEVTDYAKNHLGGCATDEFFDSIVVSHRFGSYQGNKLEAAFVCRLR